MLSALDFADAFENLIPHVSFCISHRFEDTPSHALKKRWVIVAPTGENSLRLLLARAIDDEQFSRIGNHTGGRAFWFPYTDDFWRDYRTYKTRASSSCANPGKRRTVSSPCSKAFTGIYGTCFNRARPETPIEGCRSVPITTRLK